MTQDLLSAGLELMLAGMGTVFLFLTLLVLATTAMSALVQKLIPQPAASPTGQTAEHASALDSPTAAELAAITAAIHQHRNQG